MDILRFSLYVLAPWIPFIFRKWLFSFKVYEILLISILLALLFIGPYLMGYSFSSPAVFATVFISFLIGFSTIAWLLTNNLRFALLVSLINITTILLFYFINWKSVPQNSIGSKPIFRDQKVESLYYSGIQVSIQMGVFKTYYARKEYLGGLLVKEFELNQINDSDTCRFKGFDNNRNKAIYWDKCTNKIN